MYKHDPKEKKVEKSSKERMNGQQVLYEIYLLRCPKRRA